MWNWFIHYLPETGLEKWAWWFRLFAILLPIFGGLCGWIALDISSKISKKKDTEDEIRIKRLQATEKELTKTKTELNRRIEETEKATRPKPFSERLKVFLNELDKNILPALKTGQTKFSGSVKPYQLSELQKLCSEKEAPEYIKLNTEHRLYIGPEGQLHSVDFILNPKLISNAQPVNPVDRQ